ncbi:MAG: response regulator [Desulfobacteraceae bacterium]|nr:response regulator [Desulfobacteraceae bacterium]
MGKYRPHILITDDFPNNIQIVEAILKKEGYQISMAYNGLDALKAIEKSPPDLILMDIVMPEMDGYETCKRLKASEKTKDIPLIFLTARTETDHVIKGFELGAVDYVTKPFRSAELLVRVNTHLELKRAKDLIQEKNKELSEKNEAFEQALKEIKTLEGLLPICFNCKRIRVEGSDPMQQDSWVIFELYISKRTDAEFSHGLCPACARELYPEIFKDDK